MTTTGLTLFVAAYGFIACIIIDPTCSWVAPLAARIVARLFVL